MGVAVPELGRPPLALPAVSNLLLKDSPLAGLDAASTAGAAGSPRAVVRPLTVGYVFSRGCGKEYVF